MHDDDGTVLTSEDDGLSSAAADPPPGSAGPFMGSDTGLLRISTMSTPSTVGDGSLLRVQEEEAAAERWKA